MKKLISLFLSFLFVSQLFSQWSQLQHALLSGYRDNGMVYTGTAVLIATDGGVFRSLDNGNTWQTANTGLDSSNISINGIAYAQNNVWAVAGGLFQSSNHGLLWTKNSLNGLDPNGWVNQVRSIGNRIVILYHVWDNNLNYAHEILCYSDNGSNWFYGDTLNSGGNNYFRFLSSNASALFFTDEQETFLFFSSDAISKDTIFSNGLPLNSSMKERLFSIDPMGNNLFYTSENVPVIYKYDFTTETWSPKVNGILGPPLNIFATFSLGDVAFTCVYTQNPFPAITLYRSLDTANTWVPMTNPGINIPLFQRAMLKIGNNRIIGSELFSHLYYTDNNGQTWTKNTNIYSYSYYSLYAQNDGSLLTLRSNYGLLKSIDNGQTWAQHNGNFTHFLGMYMQEDFISNGQDLFATSSSSPDGPLDLYYSGNNGQNWLKLINAPDSSEIKLIGFFGNKFLAYFEDNGQGTYQYTSDNGNSWVNISPAIDILNLNKVLGFVGNNDTLFLFGQDASYNKRIYRSVNNGSSFSMLSNGLIMPNLDILIGNEQFWLKHTMPVASFGDNNHNVIVAVMDYNIYPNQIKFFELSPTQTWVPVSPNGIEVANYVRVNNLVYKDHVWYLTTNLGVYASADNCKTWQLVWQNQAYQSGMPLMGIALHDNFVYVGTNGAGMWRTQIQTPVLTTMNAIGVTGNKAVSGGIITSIGGLPFVKKGLCYATTANPTLNNFIIEADNSFNSFTDTLIGLAPGTVYYVRAFIVTAHDTVYGNQQVFTTTAITNASLNPIAADYGLGNPSDVHTLITWHDATTILSITDNNSYFLMPTDFNVIGNTLTITQSYLSNVLVSNGQSTVLTVNFDIGQAATFTVTAVQTAINHAVINPTHVYYDLTFNNFVSTQITWNDASSITAIVDNQFNPYTLTLNDYSLNNQMLTINASYLSAVFTSAGTTLAYTINFDNGNPATLLITSVETISAAINPDSVAFVLGLTHDVKTLITWHDALIVTDITDNQTPSYSLTANDFLVDGDTLTINNAYLNQVLANAGDTISLIISFNNGLPALFTIYARDIYSAEINPDSSIFVYNSPQDVFTIITWNEATQIDSILDDQGSFYTLTSNDFLVSNDTLFILWPYLLQTIPNVSDVVNLTVYFDNGQAAVFTITTVIHVGINEVENLMSIFPNPASNYVIVNHNYTENLLLNAYDVKGSMIYQQIISSSKEHIINISDWAQGTYILNFNNNVESNKILIINR